jgi:hypothetical protein
MPGGPVDEFCQPGPGQEGPGQERPRREGPGQERLGQEGRVEPRKPSRLFAKTLPTKIHSCSQWVALLGTMVLDRRSRYYFCAPHAAGRVLAMLVNGLEPVHQARSARVSPAVGDSTAAVGDSAALSWGGLILKM